MGWFGSKKRAMEADLLSPGREPLPLAVDVTTFTSESGESSSGTALNQVLTSCTYQFRSWVAANGLQPDDILDVTATTLQVSRNGLPKVVHTLTVVFRAAPGTLY